MEDFDFDDFFVSQDPNQSGTAVTIELTDVNGNVRQVPLVLKRGLSFGDQRAAKESAITKRVKPTGEIEITNLDEDVFAIELLARGIKDWPFRQNGVKVPVTRENIQMLLADNVASIAGILINKINKKKEALQPFTKPSDQS